MSIRPNATRLEGETGSGGSDDGNDHEHDVYRGRAGAQHCGGAEASGHDLPAYAAEPLKQFPAGSDTSIVVPSGPELATRASPP